MAERYRSKRLSEAAGKRSKAPVKKFKAGSAGTDNISPWPPRVTDTPATTPRVYPLRRQRVAKVDTVTTAEPPAVVTVDNSTPTAPAVVVKPERTLKWVTKRSRSGPHRSELPATAQKDVAPKRVGSPPSKGTSRAASARVDVGTCTDPVALEKSTTSGSAPRALPKPAQAPDKPPLIPSPQVAPLPFPAATDKPQDGFVASRVPPLDDPLRHEAIGSKRFLARGHASFYVGSDRTTCRRLGEELMRRRSELTGNTDTCPFQPATGMRQEMLLDCDGKRVAPFTAAQIVQPLLG